VRAAGPLQGCSLTTPSPPTDVLRSGRTFKPTHPPLPQVDCWSVGVLAYELLAGHTPFEAVSRWRAHHRRAPGYHAADRAAAPISREPMGRSQPFAAAKADPVALKAPHPVAFWPHLPLPLALHPQRTPQETLYKIRTQEVAYPHNLSPGAADFIKRALVRAPEARTSMEELLAHDWVRAHMRRAAVPPPHARARAATAGDALAGLGLGGAGGYGFGGGTSGGGASSGGGSAAGVCGVAQLGAAAGPGSLSLPGGTGSGGGGGSWGGARPLALAGAKGALALAAAGALAGGGEGHNSSCPNILHPQVGGRARRRRSRSRAVGSNPHATHQLLRLGRPQLPAVMHGQLLSRQPSGLVPSPPTHPLSACLNSAAPRLAVTQTPWSAPLHCPPRTACRRWAAARAASALQ
jgi:uncharacterized membrane protein YgcG